MRLFARSHMLSGEIEDAMRGLRGESGGVRRRLWLQRAAYAVADYMASHRSVLPVVVALAFADLAAYVAGIRGAPTWIDVTAVRGFVFALWEVTAALLGITLVVVVFLVQSMLTQEQREEGLFRLYVRHSYILPITFLGIGLVANMGLVAGMLLLGTVSQPGPLQALAATNLLVFVGLLVAIAWLYWRTVEFLSPRFLRGAIRRVVCDGVVVGTREEIARKLGLNLLRETCEELGMAYLHESGPSGGLVVPVTMPVGQSALSVDDLDLNRLRRFATAVKARQPAHQRGRPTAWLVKGYHSVISPFFDEIGYLPVEDYSDEAASLLVGCLKTTDYREEDVLRDSLDYLKSQALRAIRSGHDDQLKEFLGTYVSAIEAWLATMRAYGIRYDPGMAQSSLYFEWESLPRIRRHLSELLISATNLGSIELVGNIAYLPVKLMRVAVSYGDHLVFQRFVDAFPEMYARAVRLPEDHACRDRLIDRAATFPVEFSRLHLEAQLVPPRGSPEEVVKASQYAIQLMIAFNSLLKSAIDWQDIHAYGRFGDALDSLFERVLRERRFDTELKLMELEQGEQRMEDSRSESRPDGIGDLEAVHRALDLVQVTRSEVWFGLAGWLLRRFRSGKIAEDCFRDMYPKAAGHFGSLGDLADIYQVVLGEDSRGDRFSWDWWEMEGSHAETIAMRFSYWTTDDWLMWFYVVRGLELTPETIGASGTPIKPALATQPRIEVLQKLCERIQNSADLCAELLPGEGLEERVKRFLTLHFRALELRLRAEEDRIIAGEISSEAFEQFRAQLIDQWQKRAVLKAVIADYGLQLNRTDEQAPIGARWTTYVDSVPKEIFYERQVSLRSYAEAVAGQLAAGEHRELVKEFREHLEAAAHVSSGSDLSIALGSAVDRLVSCGYSPNVILACGGRALYILEESDRFVASWRLESPKVGIQDYIGCHDNIPVFILRGAAQECCAALDLHRLGTLTQYRADAIPGEMLSVEVQAVDDEAASALVRRDLGWRRDKGTGRFITAEAAVRRLRKLARVQIWERWTFDIADAGAGELITVEPEHEVDTLM
jgi:hypothetical protein